MKRIIFIGLLAFYGCTDNPDTQNSDVCQDSCSRLVTDAITHYDKYDYQYVTQLADNYSCCDSSTIKSMLWWKALSYLELKQYQIAVETFSRLIALDSGFSEGYGKRGLTYDYMGLTEAALADYNRALELDPELLQERNNRAGIYRNRGELDKAKEEYSLILKKDSTMFMAYYNRGVVYSMQENNVSAIVDYKKALALDTTDQLLLSLSTAELKAGNANEALGHIDLAIQMYPQNPELYLNRAYINMHLNNVDAACDDLQRLDDMGFESEDPVLLNPCKNRLKKN